MHIAHVEVGVVRHRNTGGFRASWSPGLVEPETVALAVRDGNRERDRGLGCRRVPGPGSRAICPEAGRAPLEGQGPLRKWSGLASGSNGCRESTAGRSARGLPCGMRSARSARGRGNGSPGGSLNARAGRAEELKGYRWGRWEWSALAFPGSILRPRAASRKLLSAPYVQNLKLSLIAIS